MTSNDGQPAHHFDTEWRSAYQQYIVGNFLWACNKHGDFESKFKRWRKAIESGKHAPLGMSRLKGRQIELDERLAQIELEQKRMREWSQKQKEQRVLEAYNSLGKVQKAKCWYHKKRGLPLSQQLLLAAGISPSEHEPSSSEIESHFVDIDSEKIQAEWTEITKELAILFWDAVFIPELCKRVKGEDARRQYIEELASARRDRMRRRKEKQAIDQLVEERRGLLKEKYARCNMLVRDRDYKRGNPLDNYFRNNLRDRIASVFENSCVNCGKSEELVLDHWAIPKNEGGNFLLCRADTKELLLNVTVLCSSCNSSKGETKAVDWIGIDHAEAIERRLATLLVELWKMPKLRRVVMKWYELDLLANFLAGEANEPAI